MMAIVDLRSDTVTKPTEQMRQAMYGAEVGDDVYGDDPTVNELEALAAQIVGKEAAVLVPSGTFGNQLALFTHCHRGSEVIVDDGSHIVQNEAGAASIIAGVQLRTFLPKGPFPEWADIEHCLRDGKDIHWPRSELLALENALGNGEVLPLETMRDISERAQAHRVPLHLDGARLFNAAACLQVEPGELTRLVDSVMFCLSKGLCSPIGSLLAGSADFIREARRKRKIMGGGMRQAGVIAACGLVSLRSMRSRLGEDRQSAETLASVFRNSGLFEIRPDPVKINMFFLRYRQPDSTVRVRRLAETLVRSGVQVNPPDGQWIRIVTHHDVSAEALDRALPRIESAIEAVDR